MATRLKATEGAEKAKRKAAEKTRMPVNEAASAKAAAAPVAVAKAPAKGAPKSASKAAASKASAPKVAVSKASASKAAAAKPATSKPATSKRAASKPAPKPAPKPAATRQRDDEPAIALGLPPAPLDPSTQAYFDKCLDKIGFIPNVLQAYAFDMAKLGAFAAMYNDLMLAPSGLSKLEREMIAVAVSSVNRCYYCLTAHGAAVRQLSGDPMLGEQMVMNYRAARLDPRMRAVLDFAVKLTERPHEIEEADREALRREGLSERDIWDVSAVVGFFNMSNRIAAATDMRPNEGYHSQARTPGA